MEKRNIEEEYFKERYILDWLSEINFYYNDPSMYDNLRRLLKELIEEVREDTITYG